MKIFFKIFLFVVINNIAGHSQSCDISLRGVVRDKTTHKPLEFAEVYLQETKQGSVTNGKGEFLIKNICKGNYHLVFSHLSCGSQTKSIVLNKNKQINIELAHTQSALGHVIVTAHSTETLQEKLSINTRKIQDQLSANLGDLTEKFTGVGALKNGSAVSKPVIHGLYGNRVAILNNGVAQGGQQWGVDHAPEIDPQAYEEISVIKGVGAIKYAASQLGGIVLVEAKAIEKDPHIHGRLNTFVETNGFGTGVSGQIRQYKGKLGWKLTGTLKNSGDRKTPNYHLTNTASNQQNLALQLETEWNKYLKTRFISSFYESEIGLLRGAVANSPDDLERAFKLNVPSNTESFSFGIEAPRQEVEHLYAKINTEYNRSKSKFKVALSFQNNHRKEFDIRRQRFTGIPTLNLDQLTVQFDGGWKYKWKKGFKTELGTQYVKVDNKHVLGTNVTPLIPSYISTNRGVYTVIKKKWNDFSTELGFRYSQEVQNAAPQRQQRIIQFSDTYSNISSAFGIKYQPNEIGYHFNIGYVNRNPTIDERFSFGLHQAVSSFELGEPNLTNEKAIKTTFGIDAHINEAFTFNFLGYYYNFKDFIFLKPESIDKIKSLPTFRYRQTPQAIYAGSDISMSYEFSSQWLVNVNSSYLWAQDISNDEPFFFAPANQITASLTYNNLSTFKFLGKKWNNLSTKISSNYNFEQKRFPVIASFPELPPPPSEYNLINAQVSLETPFSKSRLRLVLKGQNILNKKYRNYLNRLRFYADEEGFNLNLTAILTF